VAEAEVRKPVPGKSALGAPPLGKTPGRIDLKRVLGFWAAFSIVVGTVIGSGIFRVPSEMVRAVGSPGRVFVVWVFGGILSLFGALTYAELSAMLPEAGGEYVYLNAAYGPFFGFVYGWTQTWVAKSASIAAMATLFVTYLADFFPSLGGVVVTIPLPIGPDWKPLDIRWEQLAAIGLIALVAAGNYRGVRLGGNAQIALTGLKLALIGGLIAMGLFSHVSASANLHSSVTPVPGGFAGFFKALVAALWAYDGWNNAGMLGSEIQRPGRNLPRAVIGGTLAIIAIYLLANLAYFSVLSSPEVAGSARVAADMMRRIVGLRGGAVVSVAVMISIFAALNGSLLSGSRVPFAMAREGYFFRAVSRVHPRFRTPSAAIALLGAWSSVILLSGHYDELYTLVIFPSWILYAMTAASVLVLRHKLPTAERPYKVLGYPVVPLLFVGVAMVLLYSTLIQSPRESAIGFGVIVAGLPFYSVWKRSAPLAAPAK
jgi:basic amino acid/polyamine antiporter, APA family